jgi:hypothetical protein
MPATTARKGSAAYEAGIREGRAMSAKARRAPEESEEPENEEEMDMDMGKKPHSRKRSAKNANNTKAPMDGGMYGKKPMDGECGCKGKKGAKCDGSCGGAMRKRGDAALTPHEYLDACDSGIQDRSRSYIRARLDAAERLDLKCGKGSISKGEKCTKGAAQEADPRAAAKQEFRTLMNNPVAANQFNKAKGSTKGVGNKIKAVGDRNMQLGAAATQVAAASKAGRMGKKQLSKEFLKSAARNAAIGVGQEAAIGGVAGFNRSGGMAGLRRRTRGAYQRATGMRSTPSGTGWASSAYDRPLRGRRDSVYASGFPLDSAALAI